jgi:hypothetical protein
MKKIALAVALLSSLALSGTAEAKRKLTIGTPTNYGGAIINGVYVTFICNSTCIVQSPDWLKGRTVVYTSSGWVLL